MTSASSWYSAPDACFRSESLPTSARFPSVLRFLHVIASPCLVPTCALTVNTASLRCGWLAVVGVASDEFAMRNFVWWIAEASVVDRILFVDAMLAFQHEVSKPLSNQSPRHCGHCLMSVSVWQVSGKGVQHHFDRWIEQLRVHRLYRQHEFAYGTRDAPRLTDVTSPVVEDFPLAADVTRTEQPWWVHGIDPSFTELLCCVRNRLFKISERSFLSPFTFLLSTVPRFCLPQITSLSDSCHFLKAKWMVKSCFLQQEWRASCRVVFFVFLFRLFSFQPQRNGSNNKCCRSAEINSKNSPHCLYFLFNFPQ